MATIPVGGGKSDSLRYLDEVDVLLVDPDQNVRDSIRHVLHDHGFRQLRSAAGRSEILQVFADAMPDLLIADTRLPDGDLCGLVHDLRHHNVGGNPFLPVIALSWQPTPELVRKVIDSGADMLLTKPISANQLVTRINVLVQSRKPFVVTSDYIGPDRRRQDDRTSDIPRFDVPNVLREKIVSGQVSEDTQARIDRAFDAINLEKLNRYAFQIGWLIERLHPSLASGMPPDAETRDHLDRLMFIAEDTGRRMVGTRHEHISDLCQALMKVTGDLIARGGVPASRDVRLLPPLGQAIRAGFRGDSRTVAAARRILEEISGT